MVYSFPDLAHEVEEKFAAARALIPHPAAVTSPIVKITDVSSGSNGGRNVQAMVAGSDNMRPLSALFFTVWGCERH